MGRRSPAWLLMELAKRELQAICDAVYNESSEEARFAATYVLSTVAIDAAAHFGDLEAQLLSELEKRPIREGVSDLVNLTKRSNARSMLGRFWKEVELFRPTKRYFNAEAHAFAEQIYMRLRANPAVVMLGGPCGKCGRYFARKRTSQTTYCSKKCGNAATALARMNVKARTLREEKLARVRLAVQTWRDQGGTNQDWKQAVAKLAEVDQRFVTQAVSRGDLQQPD